MQKGEENMPTFKNETKHYIDYEAKNVLLRFEPGEERGLPFWLPYQKLGLTLINADYPVVPNTILIGGKFNFDEGTERKFNIEPCESYSVHISVQKGKLAMYQGNSAFSIDIEANYSGVLDWDCAPYLRVKGLEAGTVATIHAEVYRG